MAEGTWKGSWNNDLFMPCGWEDARTLHIVSCIALFAKNMKTGYIKWSTF